MYAHIIYPLIINTCIIKNCSYMSYLNKRNTIMMKFDDKKFIGNTIKTYRKKLNLTQSELAEMVDLSDQHISRIESGCYVPSLPTFFDLVNVLKIDLQEFGFNIEMTSNPLKKELLDKISSATETELVFYNNLINAINSSFEKTKNK